MKEQFHEAVIRIIVKVCTMASIGLAFSESLKSMPAISRDFVCSLTRILEIVQSENTVFSNLILRE